MSFVAPPQGPVSVADLPVSPVCSKRFNRPSSLNTHMAVHTGAKRASSVCREPHLLIRIMFSLPVFPTGLWAKVLRQLKPTKTREGKSLTVVPIAFAPVADLVSLRHIYNHDPSGEDSRRP